MSRLLWICLAILGGGLLLLIVNDDQGTTLGLDNNSFAQIVYLAAILVFLAPLVFFSRRQFGHVTRNIAIWVLIILVLVAGYQYRYELQDVASRVTAGLIPGSPMSVTQQDGQAAVMLDKSPGGHFEVLARVDGAQVRFLVDTGATSTVLTEDDAKRIGIDTSALTYSVPVMTANGQARAASAVADVIAVGDIERRRLPLLVAQSGRLQQSLLGMNFLGTLSGMDVRGDRLILRD